MPASVFHFKQFSVHQDRCAMKVGTDGVLLGAWAGKNIQPRRILDVGTGTGLIALMMAQRFPNATIQGLEIEPDAVEQAQENVMRSPFADRVKIEQGDFFNWESREQYDLIVSNPPFYQYAHPSGNNKRDLARHGPSFTLPKLFATAAALLSKSGVLAVIIPIDKITTIDSNPEKLKLSRICKIAPNLQKPFHRAMLEFGAEAKVPEQDELTIEMEARHRYTSEYKALTRDFYLNF